MFIETVLQTLSQTLYAFLSNYSKLANIRKYSKSTNYYKNKLIHVFKWDNGLVYNYSSIDKYQSMAIFKITCNKTEIFNQKLKNRPKLALVGGVIQQSITFSQCAGLYVDSYFFNIVCYCQWRSRSLRKSTSLENS